MWIYIWLAVTAFALIIEFLTSEMLSIWFAGGGLVAMILAAFNVPWAVHIIAFIVVSVILLLSFRKIILKYFDKGDYKTNADMVIGKEFKLIAPIRFNEPGNIKVGDVIWNVISDNDAPVPEGTIVTVVEIKGNKYVVKVKANKED